MSSILLLASVLVAGFAAGLTFSANPVSCGPWFAVALVLFTAAVARAHRENLADKPVCLRGAL